MIEPGTRCRYRHRADTEAQLLGDAVVLVVRPHPAVEGCCEVEGSSGYLTWVQYSDLYVLRTEARARGQQGDRSKFRLDLGPPPTGCCLACGLTFRIPPATSADAFFGWLDALQDEHRGCQLDGDGEA